MDIYKSLVSSIGTVMKNPNMWRFAVDHLETKKKCKHVVKKIPYQYKTRQMCAKVILESGGTLTCVPDCYKNQETRNKAVYNYPHPLEFVPECFMIHKMCDKAVNTYPSTIKFVPECFMTQDLYDSRSSLWHYDLFLYFSLFLVSIKLKKCVTVLFLKILS